MACVQQTVHKLMSINGKRTVDSFHRQATREDRLGPLRGMSRECRGAWKRPSVKYASCARKYWTNVRVLGTGEEYEIPEP